MLQGTLALTLISHKGLEHNGINYTQHSPFWVANTTQIVMKFSTLHGTWMKMYIQEILYRVCFKINWTLYSVLWWDLPNTDDTLLHSEFGDQRPPHIFLTNCKTPHMIGALAVELKLLANQIQRRELEVLYIHTFYSVWLSCNKELKGT